MKKSWIILIGFLFLIAQPFPCRAVTGTAPANPSLQKNRIENTVAKGHHPPNLARQNRIHGNQGNKVRRIHRPNNPQKFKAGKKVRYPVATQNRVPLKGFVALVQGEAKAQIDGKGGWVPLRTGDAILPQSKLRTGKESALELKYEDGSSLLLRSDTEVRILAAWKTGTSRLLRDFFLSAGRVIAKVQKATGQSPRFRVHTPSAIASVRGTEFRVAVDKKQKTFVEVLESRVNVAAGTKSIALAKGEGAVIKEATPPLPPRKLLAPPSPVGLKPVYNTAPAIVLARIDGAKAYRVMVAKDPQGKQLVREDVIKPGETLTAAGLADGAYYLLTQSVDPVGLEGVPSEAYPLAVRENPLPPMIVTLHHEPKAKEKAAILEWLSVSDAARYHLQVSEDQKFQNLILDKSDLTDLTFKADGLENKLRYFRIRSIAKDDYQGAWSDALSFSLPTPAPASSVDQPAISPEEITLRARSVGEGFTYHIQVAKDDRFNEILIDQKVNKPEITAQKPKDAGVYFVRMAIIDRNGKAGEYSQPQSFKIKKKIPYEWLGGGGAAILLLLLAL